MFPTGVPCSVRRAVLVLAILGALLATHSSNICRAAESNAATVTLVVDYGDGVEIHFTALPWHKGMTVLDAMAAAGKHPRGITFAQRGSGGAAMITQIGDAKNQGGGAQSKNWLYYVNDEQATMSAGKQTLQPGDVALWKFQVYRYNP